MANQKTVLISGAGRGIGKGLTSHYLLQPDTTVIAGIRDPEGQSAAELRLLRLADGSALILVKLDSASREDAIKAVSDVREKHQVHHIDVVIANAGICDHLLPAADMDIDELARHVDINVYGVLRLFQATWPMLQQSALPKFVCVSSRLGSISASSTNQGAIGAYGVSKAAANYLVNKIAAENDSLIAFCVDPGLVQTEMGNRGAAFAGLAEAPVTVHDSSTGIAKEIEHATRERCVGHFRAFDGEDFEW